MEISIEKQTENAIKWIDALLSGKYSQTVGYLEDEKGYCCWGVGCRVLGIPYGFNKTRWNDDLSGHLGFISMIGGIDPPLSFIHDNGFLRGFTSLVDANDSGVSFNEIANYLIEHADTNFIPKVAEGIKLHYNR